MRNTRAVPKDARDSIGTEGLLAASRRSQAVPDQPCDIRFAHRLQLNKMICRRPSRGFGARSEGGGEVRVSRQHDRKELAICRLQPSQRDDCLQRVVAEGVGIVQDKDRGAITFDELLQPLCCFQRRGRRLSQPELRLASTQNISKCGSRSAGENLCRTDRQYTIERVQLFGKMTQEHAPAGARPAGKSEQSIPFVKPGQELCGGMPPQRIQVTKSRIRRQFEGIMLDSQIFRQHRATIRGGI
jgi:hypothetical protein